MKTFCLLFLLFILSACNGPKDGGDDKPSSPPIEQPAPSPEPTPEPVPAPEPVPEPLPIPVPEPAPVPEPLPPQPIPEITSELPPDPATTFKVNITFGASSYNTLARRTKYLKAVEVVKKVVADAEFKNRIEGFLYNGYMQFAFMSTDPCKTNDCVYQHILQGNEKLSPALDNELDLEVRFYYASTTTVGYTYANVNYIYVNTKYFDTYQLNSVAANMVHEWLHKMGYGHDSSATTRRPFSVPYGVGSIVRIVGDKYD
jgi:hypothetical protein